MNSVQLIGRIASDIQYIPCNKERALRKFAMAFRERTKPTGEDDTYFIECEAWDSVGERIDRFCQKGDRIAIAGRLIQVKFTRQDGSKSSQIKIVIHSIEFLDSPKPKEDEQQEEKIEDDELPF